MIAFRAHWDTSQSAPPLKILNLLTYAKTHFLNKVPVPASGVGTRAYLLGEGAGHDSVKG